MHFTTGQLQTFRIRIKTIIGLSINESLNILNRLDQTKEP